MIPALNSRWHLIVVACVLAAGLAVAPAVSAVQVSPGEILSDPDKYDGRDVTVAGTVTRLRETVSRKGNPYFMFDLSDGKAAVRIFSFGTSPCREGVTARVDGHFDKVKRVGRNSFYNEITATRVTCR